MMILFTQQDLDQFIMLKGVLKCHAERIFAEYLELWETVPAFQTRIKPYGDLYFIGLSNDNTELNYYAEENVWGGGVEYHAFSLPVEYLFDSLWKQKLIETIEQQVKDVTIRQAREREVYRERKIHCLEKELEQLRNE